MSAIIVMNRINECFESKHDILNIYFTAGYPNLDDTLRVAKALEQSGADMLEIGIPFSDPVADGPTIQDSSMKALENGMSLATLLDQLQDLRKEVSIPVLLMGYVNPIIQYGVEEFAKKCSEVGVDGVIVPDLPMDEFISQYHEVFQSAGLHNIFLISPNTSEDRIKEIDANSEGFIYMVSSSSITGAKKGMSEGQLEYFERINEMGLSNPRLIGFGISDKKSFDTASRYADGAIIGSAFINQLKVDSSDEAIKEFVKSIKQ